MLSVSKETESDNVNTVKSVNSTKAVNTVSEGSKLPCRQDAKDLRPARRWSLALTLPGDVSTSEGFPRTAGTNTLFRRRSTDRINMVGSSPAFTNMKFTSYSKRVV